MPQQPGPLHVLLPQHLLTGEPVMTPKVFHYKLCISSNVNAVEKPGKQYCNQMVKADITRVGTSCHRGLLVPRTEKDTI